MFSLSKIKNIKNILIILLLPTTNYSMELFVPKVVPKLSGILCSGAVVGSFIAKIGLEAISTSPKLMIGFSALSLGAGFGAYTFLNKYTPESTLENVLSTIEEHQKLMKTEMWKKILQSKENNKIANFDQILLEKYPGTFPNVKFSENDLKPQLAALKKANKLTEDAITFIDNPDRYPLLKKLDNTTTLKNLKVLQSTIKQNLDVLNSISKEVHGPDFAKDSKGFFEEQNSHLNVSKTTERIKELQNKNSRFNGIFEALFSNPVILNSVLQIILNFMTSITG